MRTPADLLERVQSFFVEQIWGVRLTELPRGRALAYHTLRILYSAYRGFFQNGLTTRAAALTYFSVLSIVPFLAFAFALLKGFGVYSGFIEGTVRPYLHGTFSGNPALLGAIERILMFVDRTNVSQLGTMAVVFLLYTSVTLVSTVEDALNVIFGATSGRSRLRQLTDYTTLLVTAPLLLVVATTLTTVAQSSRFVLFVRDTLGLGAVIDFFVAAAPILVVAVALFAIYGILPNVRTRISSALLGAVVGALLWHGVLVLHVRLQLGVARYNALYSGLAAVPIFLVWTYLSWLMVLLGAQLAASHQNEPAARQQFRMRGADQALREMLAVALGAVIAQDFLAGGPRRTAAALADLLEVPPPLVDEVLQALIRAGLVARAVFGQEMAYVPAGDVDAIRAADLRNAVRRDHDADDTRREVASGLGPGLQPILREADEGRGELGGVTLRQLAASTSTAARPVARTRGAMPMQRPDPKSPSAPA